MNPTLFILILTWQAKMIKGTLYHFLAEDEAILEDCDNEPEYLGLADILDLSDLKVEILDESVHIEGSIKIVWDADPNDRVEMQLDVFKFDRGSWQPTVFTMVHKDFCQTLFNKEDMWYKSWSQFIIPGERKCINNKGVVYNHVPFDLKSIVDIAGDDVSGRHKLVIKIDAYNRKLKKQPYSVCLQCRGDIIKL